MQDDELPYQQGGSDQDDVLIGDGVRPRRHVRRAEQRARRQMLTLFAVVALSCACIGLFLLTTAVNQNPTYGYARGFAGVTATPTRQLGGGFSTPTATQPPTPTLPATLPPYASPTPLSSASPTPTKIIPTATASASPTATERPSPSPSPAPSQTMTPVASPTATPPVPSPSPTMPPTPAPSATATATATQQPTPSSSPTSAPTSTPSPPPSPSPTATQPPTPTPSPTPPPVGSSATVSFTSASQQRSFSGSLTGCPNSSGCDFADNSVDWSASGQETVYYSSSQQVALAGSVTVFLGGSPPGANTCGNCKIYIQNSNGNWQCGWYTITISVGQQVPVWCSFAISSPSYLASGTIFGCATTQGFSICWNSAAFTWYAQESYADCHTALSDVAYNKDHASLQSHWNSVTSGQTIVSGPSYSYGNWDCNPGVGSLTQSFTASATGTVTGLAYAPSNAQQAAINKLPLDSGYHWVSRSACSSVQTTGSSGNKVFVTCPAAGTEAYTWTSGDRQSLAIALAGRAVSDASALCNGTSPYSPYPGASSGTCSITVSPAGATTMPANPSAITISPHDPSTSPASLAAADRVPQKALQKVLLMSSLTPAGERHLPPDPTAAPPAAPVPTNLDALSLLGGGVPALLPLAPIVLTDPREAYAGAATYEERDDDDDDRDDDEGGGDRRPHGPKSGCFDPDGRGGCRRERERHPPGTSPGAHDRSPGRWVVPAASSPAQPSPATARRRAARCSCASAQRTPSFCGTLSGAQSDDRSQPAPLRERASRCMK